MLGQPAAAYKSRLNSFDFAALPQNQTKMVISGIRHFAQCQMSLFLVQFAAHIYNIRILAATLCCADAGCAGLSL
jgi:hypothetical protein